MIEVKFMLLKQEICESKYMKLDTEELRENMHINRNDLKCNNINGNEVIKGMA